MVNKVFMFLTQDMLVVSSYKLSHMCLNPWACSYFLMVLKLIIHCLLLTTYFTDILHSFICVDQQFSLLINPEDVIYERSLTDNIFLLLSAQISR